MKLDRRSLLAGLGGVTLASVGAALWPSTQVMASDYKALVVLFLTGGHDGNNMLVPMDGAHADYERSRPSLARARDSLLALSGTHIGHRFGFAPSMKPLHELFERRRLAVVANVGALVRPTTLQQIRDRTAQLPLALGSHIDQERWIQGWMGDERMTGWAGRGVEQLPESQRSLQPLVSLAAQYNAVSSSQLRVSLRTRSSARWGFVDLESPSDSYSRRVEAMSRMVSTNEYETEFARSLRASMEDARVFAAAERLGPTPTGEYPADTLYSTVGSDHAWGNHWFALGGDVRGGAVHGDSFPRLITGGPIDASLFEPRSGQWLPQYSSDQFIADAMFWLGLSPDQVWQALPHLLNFPQRRVDYLR